MFHCKFLFSDNTCPGIEWYTGNGSHYTHFWRLSFTFVAFFQFTIHLVFCSSLFCYLLCYWLIVSANLEMRICKLWMNHQTTHKKHSVRYSIDKFIWILKWWSNIIWREWTNLLVGLYRFYGRTLIYRIINLFLVSEPWLSKLWRKNCWDFFLYGKNWVDRFDLHIFANIDICGTDRLSAFSQALDALVYKYILIKVSIWLYSIKIVWKTFFMKVCLFNHIASNDGTHEMHSLSKRVDSSVVLSLFFLLFYWHLYHSTWIRTSKAITITITIKP